jgi:hypothetical protein
VPVNFKETILKPALVTGSNMMSVGKQQSSCDHCKSFVAFFLYFGKNTIFLLELLQI